MNKTFLFLNLFELTLRLKGFPISEAKKKLLEIQSISEKNYEGYLNAQKEAIFKHHCANNPSYLAFLKANKANVVSLWEDIPILTKADLQKPLNKRFAKGYTSQNSYVNKTSGSSGNPFVFAKDKFCHALTWAEIFDRFAWYNLDFHTTLQARFYGIPLDTKGYYKERLKDVLSSRYRFPIFDLSNEKMESFLNTFRRKKFVYINGYTSAIVLFAKFIKTKGLVLKEVCPTLKYCVVTSEMLYESDKNLLQEILGVPVINEYGASELDLIAFTNPEGDFQINSDTLFVEIVDKNGKSVPHGTEGNIVITGLYNKSQAMIRYNIGDTGILDPISTFKKPILQSLVGRTNDIAKLPSGKTVPGLTFYYVTKSVIEDDGNVKEFIIEQHKLDVFKITYVSEKELVASEITTIKEALATYLEPNLNLLFERVSTLNRNNRGKLKQFVSLLS